MLVSSIHDEVIVRLGMEGFMNEWINVKDRLPEIGKQNAPYSWSEAVLCCLLDKTIHILNLTDLGNWINFQGQYSTLHESVTHWMSLPELPNDHHS